MELLNVSTARSVWLFDTAELNPTGKKFTPDLFVFLNNIYKFEKTPTSIVDLEDNALVFSRGEFKNKAGITVGIELKIYNDGLLANARSSTRDTDDFLEEVLILCSKEFELSYKHEMIRYKIVFSEVNVQSNKRLNGINTQVNKFTDKISISVTDEPKAPFELSAIIFSPGQTIPNFQISPFTLERKTNTMPEEGKYYSRAPLHTDIHINLLNDLESLFMA